MSTPDSEWQEVEQYIDKRVSEQMEQRKEQALRKNELLRKTLDIRIQFLPEIGDLNLKHLDTILDSLKSLVVLSSTLLVASLSINAQQLGVFSVKILRIGSIVFFVTTVILVIFILRQRNSAKSQVAKKYEQIQNQVEALIDIEWQLLDISNPENVEKIKNQVKTQTRAHIKTQQSQKHNTHTG